MSDEIWRQSLSRDVVVYLVRQHSGTNSKIGNIASISFACYLYEIGQYVK